jgi:hypothetical protein
VGSSSRILTLQKHNTENSKHVFTGKELRGYSPNSYIGKMGYSVHSKREFQSPPSTTHISKYPNQMRILNVEGSLLRLKASLPYEVEYF